MGDLILLLSSAYNDPYASIFFFANAESINFIDKMLKLFGIRYYLKPNIMGKAISHDIYNYITRHSRFKTSAHLPDRLDHGDWAKNNYKERIITKTRWKEQFGSIKTNIIICPSGSVKNNHRKRYLTITELNNLCKKYDQVFLTGSEQDIKYYGKNHTWITSDFILEKGFKRKIDLKTMLQMINGAEKLISVDTWIKTYSLLVDIDTEVIQTKWGKTYKEYGEDPTDYIFLNKEIWPKIKISKIEDLIQ